MKYYKECPYCGQKNNASATTCTNCYESLMAVMPTIIEEKGPKGKFYKLCPVCGEKNYMEYKDQYLPFCSLCHYEKINDCPSVMDEESKEEKKPHKVMSREELLNSTPDLTRVKRLALRNLTDYHVVTIPEMESIIGRYGNLDPSYFSTFDHISGNHLLFYYDKGICTIEDLGSTNGTKLNGERVVPGKKFTIKKGDLINISRLAFEVVEV